MIKYNKFLSLHHLESRLVINIAMLLYSQQPLKQNLILSDSSAKSSQHPKSESLKTLIFLLGFQASLTKKLLFTWCTQSALHWLVFKLQTGLLQLTQIHQVHQQIYVSVKVMGSFMCKFINLHTFTKLTSLRILSQRESVKQDKNACFMVICCLQLLRPVIKLSTLITQFLTSLCTRICWHMTVAIWSKRTVIRIVLVVQRHVTILKWR